MQIFNALFLISTLLLAILSNAAPTKGKGKGKAGPGEPDIQVLLRETKKNSENWHFAVAIRRADSDQDTLYEYVINKYTKQMVRSIERQTSKTAAEFPVSGNVLKAGGESDLDAVATKIRSIIIDKVPSNAPIPEQGSFTNCFDFADMAFKALHDAKYISDDTMNKFTAYFNAHKDQVHSETDEHTRQYVYPPASSSKKGSS